MKIAINNIGDLIRELQKHPPYAPIFNENSKPFEEIRYINKIPFYDPTKHEWNEKEGFKLI